MSQKMNTCKFLVAPYISEASVYNITNDRDASTKFQEYLMY